MKKSRFTEVQIINILKEYDSGKAVKDLCRENGIAVPTFYSWKRKIRIPQTLIIYYK
jgi:putative transposase